MPFCNDKAARELNDKGYSLVKYPRTNILPLDVVAGESSPLNWLGSLTVVWTGKETPPSAIESSAPNFLDSRSNEIKGSLGIRILEGLLKNIGAANADARGSISSTLSFTYESPRQLAVSPLQLGAFLKQGDLDLDNPTLKRYLEIDRALETRFYVITEVLRARKLLVRVSGENTVALEADVRALQSLAAASSSINQKSSRDVEIAFDGNTDLTFAFKAFELGYVDGEWVMLGAGPSGGYLSATGDTQEPVTFGPRPVALT